MAIEFLPDRPQPGTSVLCVDSFASLFAAGYTQDRNAILFSRRIAGDFNALANRLADGKRYIFQTLTRSDLEEARAGVAGDEALALDTVLQDMREIENADPGRVPILRVQPAEAGSSSEWVFHPDGTFLMSHADQLLINYNGAPTEWLCNRDAVRAGSVSSHYDSREVNSPVYAFPLRNPWRHACRHRDQAVHPFIHRAPHVYHTAPVRMFLSAFKSVW